MRESFFSIDTVLGEGAMGTVYRGSLKGSSADSPQVAIKVMSERSRRNELLRARFEREAELVGAFDHPNLVSILATGTTADGERYIVMDLVDGRDLGALIDETPMPTWRVIHIVKQICDGLQHAHDRGVIHRDLKHGNILVERNPDSTDRIRIIDFGIALQPHRRARRLTPAAHAMGSPCCLAPESATGAATIDHRVDLFALGVIAYQLTCGYKPFSGTGYEVLCANIGQPTPLMADRAPGVIVDPLLEAFARRLLEKRPEHRFATAREAGEILALVERDRGTAGDILFEPPKLARGTLKMPQLSRPTGS